MGLNVRLDKNFRAVKEISASSEKGDNGGKVPWLAIIALVATISGTCVLAFCSKVALLR